MPETTEPRKLTEEAVERWLPVVGYEDAYEVSDRGRVRSIDRVSTYHTVRNGLAMTVTRSLRGKVLSPGVCPSGHMLVVLTNGKSKLVHALVLTAFVGPRPPGYDSLHRNGIPPDNRLENLRWGTRSENVQDSIKHGTFQKARLGRLRSEKEAA